MENKTEISAGGIVLKEPGSKILMVEVENLKGEIVWTFPKGHIEPGEGPEDAALREVLEETGWQCDITWKKPLEKVEYFFMRGRTKVRKQVTWFLMNPLSLEGERDPQEIRKVQWMDLKQAKKKVKYPSDKKLLARIEEIQARTE